MSAAMKYPRTPYWPTSPSIAADDGVKLLANPSDFLNKPLVITEKLDGSNTLLHQGEVYGRSVDSPSHDKWRAMVRKHHAWKTQYYTGFVYGEDIYGVHSIEYDPVAEWRTFYAFAALDCYGTFWEDWGILCDLAEWLGVPVVPVVADVGIGFTTVKELDSFLAHEIKQPSALGGPREGLVIRLGQSFLREDFNKCVAKYVRPDHVQTDEHWTRNWKPCKLLNANQLS